MPSDLLSVLGQPKLRASCDGCGTAKTKCDRGQPECARCVAHRTPCVYGVSRKKGKPLRGPKWASTGQTNTTDSNSIHSTIASNDTYQDANVFPGITCGPEPWEITTDNSNTQRIDPGTWRGYSDISRPSVPVSSLFDFNGWAPMSYSNDNGIPSTSFQGLISASSPSPGMPYPSPNMAPTTHPMMENPARPEAQPAVHQTPSNHNLVITSTQDADMKYHDCSREAYRILGALSFFDPGRPISMLSSGRASPSIAGSNANRVPLDHVLRLSCDAMEQLEPLLDCTCSGAAPLSLLNASIISQIMLLYEQVARCSEHTSLAPIMTARAIGTDSNTETPPPAQGTNIAFEPATTAIGTFNVDDKNIQAALKIQLLLCEMKKAGRLIGLLTSHNHEARTTAQESSERYDDTLYKCLDSWLRSEHSRVVNMMRSKLREYDA